KAKAFRDAWTPSLTATTTFTFNYGTLAAPTANPPGGMYPTGQLVTLSAASGAQVRYTLDGTDPGVTSAPYVAPFELPDGLITWNVYIDRTAPAVHVYSPAEGSNVPSGTTSVTIRGGAAELSGLDSASCNGVTAMRTGNLFTCTVSLTSGANTITIEATDAAGNTASTGVTFTVGDTNITALEISPGTMTMFAG